MVPEAERGTEMSNITDRERRRVAAELRCIGVSDLTPKEMDNGKGVETLCARIAGVITDYRDGLHYAPYFFDAKPFLDRLADLIDPVTPNHSEVTPKCDRDALLALAREMDEFAYTPDGFGNVDKRAGRMIYPPMTHEFASRIREACGIKEEG